MFIQFQRPNGKRALLAIDKIVGFLETEDGCQILVNAPPASAGARGHQPVLFTVQCADSYDSLVTRLARELIHTPLRAPVPASEQQELFAR